MRKIILHVFKCHCHVYNPPSGTCSGDRHVGISRHAFCSSNLHQMIGDPNLRNRLEACCVNCIQYCHLCWIKMIQAEQKKCHEKPNLIKLPMKLVTPMLHKTNLNKMLLRTPSQVMMTLMLLIDQQSWRMLWTMFTAEFLGKSCWDPLGTQN